MSHPRVEEVGWEDTPEVQRMKKEKENEKLVAAAEQQQQDGGYALASLLKDKGNSQFKSGDYEDAIATYNEALTHLTLIPVPVPSSKHGEKVAEEKEVEQEEKPTPTPAEATLASQIFANCALCHIKRDEHKLAIPLLMRAIAHDEKYAKAYYRRAESYYAEENYSAAHADYTKCYEELGMKGDADVYRKMQDSKAKMDEQTQKALGELKQLGNTLLGKFGLSLDNFKMEKDPKSGGYSVNFQK
eukprot:PhM_4_TR19/c0_g1_i1/m.38610